MLRTKNIQKKGSQTAQNTQETEGSDYPQQQDDLWVKAVIWKKEKHHKALQEAVLETEFSKNSEVICCDLRETRGFWFQEASSA